MYIGWWCILCNKYQLNFSDIYTMFSGVFVINLDKQIPKNNSISLNYSLTEPECVLVIWGGYGHYRSDSLRTRHTDIKKKRTKYYFRSLYSAIGYIYMMLYNHSQNWCNYIYYNKIDGGLRTLHHCFGHSGLHILTSASIK